MNMEAMIPVETMQQSMAEDMSSLIPEEEETFFLLMLVTSFVLPTLLICCRPYADPQGTFLLIADLSQRIVFILIVSILYSAVATREENDRENFLPQQHG